MINKIPHHAGIGLRNPHILEFLENPPKIGWLEVHSENYLDAGGPRVRALEKIRQDFPLSCHGVGLSLGSAEGLDQAHLKRLKALYTRFQPGLISDHVSWSIVNGLYTNDLLPLPYTEESLDIICRNIQQAQEFFGQKLLVENPSSYITFLESMIPEWEFINAIIQRTGCGLLLDVNNIYVSSQNNNFDPDTYLAAIPQTVVEEIHIAGHLAKSIGEQILLIDHHGAKVADPVWQLLDKALAKFGTQPILMEWDTDIPELSVLLAEAAQAQDIMNPYYQSTEPVE